MTVFWVGLFLILGQKLKTGEGRGGSSKNVLVIF